MKVISVSSDNNNPGCLELKRSLTHYGYEFDFMYASFEFGRQMQYVYQWCKSNWGWFIYTDAWDTFALSDQVEVMSKLSKGCKMLMSAEKNCYPIREMAERYPYCESEWRYVNGGGFMADAEFFISMYEDGTHQHDSNDQQWLGEQYIKRYQDGLVHLDSQCKIFQTIAFENTWDFSRVVEPINDYVNGWKDRIRLVNNHTKEKPIFIHGNAHTPMAKIYKLI